ncbi:TrkA C-terminal domain-containing protein [Streptomyces sp. NPDC018693]|uniref:TrkA C-terminal domain-containing protein n=1 Tax=unclassified Streptomyces TaxID=2593676 RepID=UPI0037AC4126
MHDAAALGFVERAVRGKYGVTVVGIERPGEDFTHATGETVMEKGHVIIVTDKIQAVESFAEPG